MIEVQVHGQAVAQGSAVRLRVYHAQFIPERCCLAAVAEQESALE